MTVSVSSSLNDSSTDSTHELSPSEWLASIPFGEGLRRSINILRQQFSWLVIIFFIGGFSAALVVFPIDLMIAFYSEQLTLELLNFNFDIFLLTILLIDTMALSWLREFIITFTLFILGVLSINRIVQKLPPLEILNQKKEPHRMAKGTVLKAGILVALILASASLVALPYPIMYILLFFTPALIVLADQNASGAIRKSMQMRHKNWRRIFGTILFCVFLNIFAGTLGVMVYFNIEIAFTLLGVSFGWIAPVLLAILTQLPVAMVAPIFSILALVFYSGAKAASEDELQRQYMRRQRLLQHRRSQLIPLSDQPTASTIYCPKCGKPVKQNAVFCSFCGERISRTFIVSPDD